MTIHTIELDDWRYPQGLLGNLITEYPERLWVNGDPGVLNRKAIAVVGARASTGYGEHVAHQFATAFVEAGYAIVSGAAYGIDGAAHRAALAAGGATIAYLAGGVDRFYPAGHQDLIQRITEFGAVVSEYEPGASPTKERFLLRNRLIGAHADALVVIEAGSRSGSLNAAHQAHKNGIPVFAVPGPITSPTSSGAHRLIREGFAQLADSAAVILEQLA